LENTPVMLKLAAGPLVAGFILLFLPNRVRLLSKIAAVVISAAAIYMAMGIATSRPEAYSASILQIGAFELSLTLTATKLGSYILVAACGFGFLITLYSLRAIGPEVRRQSEYYGSILLTIGGSAGILLADHLLVLLICWEIVTASLYLMITTGGRNSNFAGTKSFAMIGASDGALLLGIAMLWLASGTFVISEINVAANSAISVAAFLLLMVAAITKAGAMPMHTWIPTSGEYAPVPVMALLPAAIDKLLGIYLLVVIVRQLFVITASLQLVLAIIGAATVLLAVMIAMVQHNLKKLLSYHAISQVGYMVLGIATGTTVGLVGGVFHMINHAIYKSCLFLCGGAVEKSADTAELEELGGLGTKMPITFACCMIAALSISGVPPFNGFVSKWMVYQGVIDMRTQAGTAATLWPVWFTCAMFGSALTLASFVKVLHSVFLSRRRDALGEVRETSFIQWLPMAVLATLCVLLGVFYKDILGWFLYPALSLGAEQVTLSDWQSGLATVLLIVGLVIGFVIWLIGKKAIKVREVQTWYCGESMENEKMVIPGTHFYKTVSRMGGLKQLYSKQEKGWFDLYDQAGRVGLTITELLQRLHNGILPRYLTWVTLGLLLIIYTVCKNIW
jgi:formate hydrogenlyase subunit 3/multisubunit Na+/H+ antiporter MnhD subunit